MIIGTIKHKYSNKEAKVIKLVKNKRIKVNYSKLLNSLAILIVLTKYKSLAILIYPHFPFGIEQGRFKFGIDLWYRLKNVDHVGFDVELNIIFATFHIEFSDRRHVEDY